MKTNPLNLRLKLAHEKQVRRTKKEQAKLKAKNYKRGA